MNSGQKIKKASTGDKDSVSASLIIGLLKSARSLGVDFGSRLERLELDDQALKDPVSRIPYSILIALLDDIYRLSNYRREIGVELGCRLMTGSYSALGYAAASCETLGEAIKVIPLYENVTLTPGKTTIEITGEWVQLNWTTTRKPYSYLLEEAILSSWLNLAGSFTAKQGLQVKATFTGPQPEMTDSFHALFGNDIAFNQPVASVLFHASLLDIPITQFDPFINNIMKEQAARIHQSLDYKSTFSYAVAECINRALVQGDVRQENISQQLGMGVRTLRRRLKDEGTRFQIILDSVRRENSRKYLGNEQMTVCEIAMLLGYKEHSAFSVAFKRWFGVSPQSYRDSLD